MTGQKEGKDQESHEWIVETLKKRIFLKEKAKYKAACRCDKKG